MSGWGRGSGYELNALDVKINKCAHGPDGVELWQYGLWNFQTEYTKLERFLHKNQHTQRKILNFEIWAYWKPQ